MSYEAHPRLDTPPDNTVLWRYMDLAKLLQVLETRSLWFCRLDRFEDPLEGTWTDAELSGFEALPFIPPQTLAVRKGYIDGTLRVRRASFVNCWREGAEESMAMWDLYRRGSGVVAIKSTVALLREAADQYDKTVYISRVKYVDWNVAPWDNNLVAMCVRKALSYGHESEVRAVIWDSELMSQQWASEPQAPVSLGPAGIALPIDPCRLIIDIMVGPREPAWLISLVENVARRYGLTQSVIGSTLLKPRYK